MFIIRGTYLFTADRFNLDCLTLKNPLGFSCTIFWLLVVLTQVLSYLVQVSEIGGMNIKALTRFGRENYQRPKPVEIL
jgi:hypothetical protein